VLYGHQVVGLSFPLVGLGLSVAAGVSLATVPLQGSLVDRFGARTLQIAAHLVRAVGFLGLLLAHSFPVFLLLAALVALGDATPAGLALVADLAAPDERDRWFGLRRVLANAGVGVGGVFGGVAVATGGYQVIVVLNAVSFVAAAGMLTRLPMQTTRSNSSTGSPATPSNPSASLEARAGESRAARHGVSGYRAILRDHPFLVLLIVSVVFWMSNYSVDIILAPYSVSVLRVPLWVPGALFALNTALIVGAQVPVMGLLASRRRTRTMMVGGIGYMVAFLGLAATPLLPAHTLVVTLGALMLLATMAEIILIPTMTALAAAMAPLHLRGRYLTLANLSLSTAKAITPLVATALLVTIPSAFWLILTVVLLVAVAAVAWLERRLPIATVLAPADSPQRSHHASPAGDGEPGVAASEALTSQNRPTAPGHP
jgi:MFS family permease